MMTYSPLVVGESEDFLTITNQLAGTSMYKIIAKCLPAKEKDVEYSTTLGSCIPIRFRVQNKTDLKADFVATVCFIFVNWRIVEKLFTAILSAILW